jgi:hypothetical protein
MANTGTGDGTVVKQEPTGATYGRVATVGASTIIGPQVVQPLISYAFDIVRAFAPTFPAPSEGVMWSLATLICGGVATWASFSLRGTRVQPADPADRAGA